MSGIAPEYFDIEMRVSRKNRVCYECKCKISRGDVYHRHFGKWDGEFDSFHLCDHCHSWYIKVSEMTNFDEAPPYGELWNFILECFDPDGETNFNP